MISIWGRAGWSEQVYRVQKPEGFDQADRIFLVSQPLAWLVPAFDSPKPFIQLAPNFPVSAAYIEKVNEQLSSSSNYGIIFNPLTIPIDVEIPDSDIEEFFPPEVEIDLQASNTVLQLFFDLEIDDVECETFTGSFGLTEFEYGFCLETEE